MKKALLLLAACHCEERSDEAISLRGKIVREVLLLLACGCLILSVWGCAEQAQQVVVENHPPQLLSMTADRTIVGLGETASITVSATDPDGDTLTFSWLATAGEIQGTGSQVVWVAPNDWGTQFIRCEVSDGRGGVDYASVSIRTQEDAPPTITSLGVQPSIVRPTGGTATINAHIVDATGTWVASADATLSLGGSTLADLDLVRASGDSQEGDYQVTYPAAANATSQPQTYTVTATATDEAGHTSQQATTAFAVEAVATPPPPPT